MSDPSRSDDLNTASLNENDESGIDVDVEIERDGKGEAENPEDRSTTESALLAENEMKPEMTESTPASNAIAIQSILLVEKHAGDEVEQTTDSNSAPIPNAPDAMTANSASKLPNRAKSAAGDDTKALLREMLVELKGFSRALKRRSNKEVGKLESAKDVNSKVCNLYQALFVNY